jgi:hypothetical protein
MVLTQVQLAIDSRHRNDPHTTPPNNYKWDLGRVHMNCRTLEVLFAEVPGSIYNVPEDRNSFKITQTVGATTTTLTCSVTPGNYDKNTLLTAVNNAWTAAGGTSNLSFTLDAITEELVLSSTDASTTASTVATDFAYPFGWHATGTVPANGSLRAGGMVRLAADASLYLFIPEVGSGDDIVFSPEGGKLFGRGLIGRFQMRAGSGMVNYFQDDLFAHKRKIQDNPSVSLSHLTIIWKNAFGDVVNFHGVDHSLFVKLTCDE